MNEDAIKNAIEDIKSKTTSCANDNYCINLLIKMREFLFSLPAKDQSLFIFIAEDDYGIFFDNASCKTAIEKCKHPNSFNEENDM
jgi:hypothetical protein